MGSQAMDLETAESVAAVVRLLFRAADLVWARAELDGPRSPLQMLALGIDLAAGEARLLLPEAVDTGGPTPVGDDPALQLRSAEQLMRRITSTDSPPALVSLASKISDLVREANTSADA